MADRIVPSSGWMDIPLSTAPLPDTVVEAKKATVQESAVQKMALLGSKEEQRLIATAEIQGNRLAQGADVQDIRGLGPADFAAKYGHEAERLRASYSQAVLDLELFKDRERTGAQVAGDSALDVAKMAANTVGSAGILGLNAQDVIFGTTAGPIASEGLSEVNRFLESQQSQLMQDRRAQHQLEAQLDGQDRAALKAERVAAAGPEASAWDRAVLPTLQDWGGAFAETVQNYGDDPIMMGSLAPEAIGSLIPATAGIKIAGKARALSTLAGRGIAGDAAETFLKSKEGRSLLEAETLRVAPLVMGATETGGAVHQGQLDILGQDETTLAQSPEYQALRAQGMGHDDAQMQLAREAGTMAGAVAAPGAVLAGKLAAGVAAYPMRVTAGNPTTSLAGNVVQEGAEETLQEMNAQLATNVGAKSIGLDRALDEGVAEAGAQGLLGGVASVAALQTPAAVGQTALNVTASAIGSAKSAGERVLADRRASLEEQRDASDPIGPKAQAVAAVELETAAQELIAGLPAEATPNQTEAQQPEGPTLSERLMDNHYAEDSLMQALAGPSPAVAQFMEANPGARLSRVQAVKVIGDLMGSVEDVQTRGQVAVDLLTQVRRMRRLDSTEVSTGVAALADGDPLRASYDKLRTSLAVLEESSEVQMAKDAVAELTPEMIDSIAPLSVLEDPETSPELKADIRNFLDVVLEVNPLALGSKELDQALSQTSGEDMDAETRTFLTGARETAYAFEQNMSVKELLEERSPDYGKGDLLSRQDIVSEQIRVRGNARNSLPSLKEHRARVLGAMSAGRMEDAQDALQDLRDFAQTLANKIAALNVSAKTPGNPKVPYEASGPFGLYLRGEGVFGNVKSEKSRAMAQAAHADAVLASRLVELLADQNNLAVEKVSTPDLVSALIEKPKAGPAPVAPKPAEKPVKPVPKSPPKPKAPKPEAQEKAAEYVRPRREKTTLARLKTDYRKARTAVGKAEKALAAETMDTPAYEAAETEFLERTAALQGLDDAIVALGGTVPVTKPKEVPAPTAPSIEEETAAQAVSDEAPREEPTPVPEAVEEPVLEVEAPARDAAGWMESLKEVLPKTGFGEQGFLEGFRPAGNGSRLISEEDPNAWLHTEVDTGGARGVALQGLLDNEFPELSGKLQEAIDLKLKAKGWDTPEKLAKALLFSEAVMLNLGIQREGAPLHIEPRAMLATAIATYEWMGQNARKPRAMDDEEMAKRLGLEKGAHVDWQLANALHAGPVMQSALESIAAAIGGMLDIQARPDADPRFSQGILRGLAANALEQLMDVQDKDGNVTEKRQIAWRKVSYKTAEGPRDLITLNPHEGFREDPKFKALADERTPFSNLLTDGRAKERLVGDDRMPKAVAQTRLHNRLSRLSEPEKAAIKRLQFTPAFVNKPMVELLRALGEGVFRKLHGHVELTPKERERYSPDHLSSIEGKNQTIEHDLGETLGYVGEAEFLGEQTPIYFGWEISSVGRLQQQGPVTPQGSKIAREILSSTNATLELGNEKHEWAMWAAVAQSLGAKIEKLSRDDIPAAAKAMLYDGGKYAEALRLLEVFEDTGELDAGAFMAAVKGKANSKELHALLTVARWNVARARGEETITTALALEADGKTDGPVNAMIHMGIGDFKDTELELFAKGGLFFSDRPISLAEFIAIEDKKGEDIYNMASRAFEANLSESLAAMGDKAPSVLGLLYAFLPDFKQVSVEDAEGLTKLVPQVGRNVIKNPLTVFLYGSSNGGIANKIAGQLREEIGKFLTELIQNGEQGLRISQHEKLAVNPQLIDDMADVLFGGSRSELIEWLKQPTKSRLNREQMSMLADRVLEAFVEPMVEAIDETTGGLQARMKFLQGASTIQTLLFQNLFQKKLNERLAEREEELRPAREAEAALAESEGREPRIISSGYPTMQEMQDIFAATMKVAPIYGGDVQEFQISMPEKDAIDGREVSRSLNGRLKAGLTSIAPADASVKVSPFLTIGNGDGRMILNIYVNGDGSFDVSLPVFDGVEMALDTIEEASGQINEQTYEAWQAANPYRDVHQGYSQALAYLDPATMDPKLVGQILRTAQGMKLKGPVDWVLAEIGRKLKVASMQREARANAMRRAGLSADHMASAQVPFFQEGANLEGGGKPTDYKRLSGLLNGLYVEELGKLSADAEGVRDTVAGYAQAPTKALQDSVQLLGRDVAGHPGVRQLGGEEIVKLLSGPVSKTGATAEQRSFVRDLQKLGGFTGSNFFFGDPAALEGLRDAMNLDPVAWGLSTRLAEEPIELGQSFEKSAIVFVANVAPETVIHELLHQVTARVLTDHYADPRTSATHVRHAVGELEKLMSDVIELNAYGLDPVDAKALTTLQSELRRHANDPAARLGEFISYSLSNPGLIEKGQKTRNYRALGSVVQRAMKFIKRILGFKADPGLTLYSNIRFNARLLLAQEPELTGPEMIADQTLEVDRLLSQVYGDDFRLDQVESAFLGRLHEAIRATVQESGAQDPATIAGIRKAAQGAIAFKQLAGQRAAARAAAAGVPLNAREQSVFEVVYAAAASDLTAGTPTQRHMNEALGHVMTNLKAADLVKAGADQAQAARIVSYVTESQNQSELLPIFFALSQTSPLIRDTLAQMAPPKVIAVQRDSVDAWFQSIARGLVNLITRMSLRPRKMSPDMRKEMDALAGTFLEAHRDRLGLAELRKASDMFGRAVETANDYASRKLAQGSEMAGDALSAVGGRITQPHARFVVGLLEDLVSVGSSTAADATAATWSRMLNETEGWNALRSAWTDMRGMNDDNAPLWRMINPAKAKIDAVRQDSREGVPKHLAAAFSHKLSGAEWSRMHKGLAKTDVLALGHARALELLRDPEAADRMTQAAEEAVATLGGRHASRYKAKARALAIYMATGKATSQNLLPNAYAIANLFGEKARPGEPSEELVTAIDELASLYAWQETDQATRDALSALAQTEEMGMQAVTGFLGVARGAEISRRDAHGGTNGVARNNGWKGYVPATAAEGHQIVVRPVAMHREMLQRGYVQVGTYRGDENDARAGAMAYYQTAVGGKGAFRQGVAQTVNDTWQGVDAHNGLSVGGASAGVLLGARVGRVAARLQGAQVGSLDGLPAGEYMRPVFDADGGVVAYERLMDPEKLAAVPVDDHLGRMLGVWVGRVLEESLADEVNKDLVGVMKEIYDQARTKGELGGFVNLAGSAQADPVIKDAWNTLGWRMKAEIEDVFGPGEFWVRRDMVDDVIGFRAATVTDAWTGVSRWSPETQAKVREVAELVAGDKGFKYLRQGDKALREAVSWAKETIIIRSVTILVDNVLSNVAHLFVLGIPISDVLSGSRNKFSEITEYEKNREEIQGLQVEMAAVLDNPAQLARLQTRIGVLEKANGKLSIAPLLEAGEFNTIAEGLDEADVAMREGKIGEFFGRQIDKLPGWGKTAVKNLAITKDTALYQGLTRGVQYGDFIAKAVLYDHLTKVKGMTQREALDRVLEEFIPYNRLAGRDRDVLEAMGIAWFLNYKLRSLPVLVRTLRERPLSALTMFTGGGALTGVQSLWDGSLVGSVASGNIEYSVGPGMGLNALNLHPVGGFVM